MVLNAETYDATRNMGVACRLMKSVNENEGTGQGCILGQTASDGLCSPSHGIPDAPRFPDQIRSDLHNY